METIAIKFDISGIEISIDNRWELTQSIDKALQDSGGQMGKLSIYRGHDYHSCDGG